MNINVGIWGINGYSGQELLKFLAKNQHYKVVYTAGTKSEEGSLSDVCFAILAPPHQVSMELVSKLWSKGVSIIDMSGAYRFQDPAIYEKWYGFRHKFPELLPFAVYGLPELKDNKAKIRFTELLANPGCYATAVILALLPLAEAGLLSGVERIKIDAVSGYSGGERKALPPSAITPYKNGNDGREHQHVPEIEMALGLSAGQIHFFPAVAPRLRGIEIKIKMDLSVPGINQLYKNRYWREKYVLMTNWNRLNVVGEVEGTNFCQIAVREISSGIEIAAVIDNLGKGAAGQAVQNLDLMCGL